MFVIKIYFTWLENLQINKISRLILPRISRIKTLYLHDKKKLSIY